MGQRLYGTTSGVGGNGQVFYTDAGTIENTTNQTTRDAQIAAGHTLEVAVSTSLVAAVTGASGAGSMDRNVKTTLSSSYSSVTGTIPGAP